MMFLVEIDLCVNLLEVLKKKRSGRRCILLIHAECDEDVKQACHNPPVEHRKQAFIVVFMY